MAAVKTLYSLENPIREGNNETPKKRQRERWEDKVKERDERKSAKKRREQSKEGKGKYKQVINRNNFISFWQTNKIYPDITLIL